MFSLNAILSEILTISYSLVECEFVLNQLTTSLCQPFSGPNDDVVLGRLMIVQEKLTQEGKE